MATAKVKTTAVSDSLKMVIDTIKAGRSFILEAGAGSGKTWTLIEVLKFILMEYGASLLKSSQHIACITYTNVAANEIHERIENDPLVFVSTIHEFLWSVIEKYQSELRIELIEYNKQKSQ
jgi:DNA helicase-2/ATP-dependent DNA helicase PcrA